MSNSKNLYLLLAMLDPAKATALEEAVGVKLDQQLEGINIHVKIVTTLKEAMIWSPESDATIIELVLADANEDQVVAALSSLKSPVVVVTEDKNPVLHARCKEQKARVLVPSLARKQKIYDLMLECFADSILNQNVVSSA